MEALFSRLSAIGGVSDDDLAALARLPHRLTPFEGGAQIVSAGALTDFVFVIESGWGMRTRTLADGRRQVVNFMLPGDCFDLQSLVHAQSDHAVSAITPMRIRILSARSFLSVIRGSAALAAGFWWVALQEESILREQIVRLGKRGARERLAHLLLELRRRQIAAGADDSVASQAPLTREILADALGLSIVHVSRVVSQFAKAELLAVRHRLLQVLDYPALARFCGFDATYLHISRPQDFQDNRLGSQA